MAVEPIRFRYRVYIQIQFVSWLRLKKVYVVSRLMEADCFRYNAVGRTWLSIAYTRSTSTALPSQLRVTTAYLLYVKNSVKTVTLSEEIYFRVEWV